jgi:hypothetical protein
MITSTDASAVFEKSASLIGWKRQPGDGGDCQRVYEKRLTGNRN